MAKNDIYGCRLVGPSIGATVYCKCCRPTFLCGHFGILVYFSCSCLQITIWRWNKCICFGNLRHTGIVPNYCNRFLISQRSILLHFSSREKYVTGVTSSTKLKRDQKFSETSTERKPSRSAWHCIWQWTMEWVSLFTRSDVKGKVLSMHCSQPPIHHHSIFNMPFNTGWGRSMGKSETNVVVTFWSLMLGISRGKIGEKRQKDVLLTAEAVGK